MSHDVKAINKIHQANVSKFLRFNGRYDDLVSAGKEESVAASVAYQKASEFWDELPKREQVNICKQVEHVENSYF